MKNFLRRLLSAALVSSLALSARAAEPVSAKDLAAQLSALQQDGSSFVRLKLDVNPPGGAPKFGLQLQIKQRRAKGSTEVVYQVLWPKERAGEAVLLKQSGGQLSGTLFTPPATYRNLTAANMKESLFGSDISYGDVLENFFAWENQKIVGTETVNRVECQILESRSGSSGARSWIDTKRLVPLRIEKYSPSGAAIRRIETTRVATDDMNRNIPANLTIQNLQKGSSTELDGSKIRHGVTYADRDFTRDGLSDTAAPRS